LLDLIKSGNDYVKISAPYRTSGKSRDFCRRDSAGAGVLVPPTPTASFGGAIGHIQAAAPPAGTFAVDLQSAVMPAPLTPSPHPEQLGSGPIKLLADLTIR
jgi:hypothetical protein